MTRPAMAMAERRAPLYLARRSYRRRRLTDALRLLPVMMGILWLLPLLWGGPGTDSPTGEGSRAVIHVFAIWGLGIIAAILISRALVNGEDDVDGEESRDDGRS